MTGKAAVERALGDDLNLPEALAALFEMIREGNRALDENALAADSAQAVQAILDDLDRVFAFLAPDGARAGDDVQALVAQRQAARQAKNWAESDRLRQVIDQAGWIVQDSPTGPKLKRK